MESSAQPSVRDFQVVVDCRDPDAMAAFWAEALGYEPDSPPGGHNDWMAYQIAAGFTEDERVGFAAISDPRGHGRLCFMGVPEPKVSKNRLHLDIRATDRADDLATRTAKVDALASHGMDEIEIPAFLRQQAD